MWGGWPPDRWQWWQPRDAEGAGVGTWPHKRGTLSSRRSSLQVQSKGTKDAWPLLPTMDTCRYSYILRLATADNSHVLVTGPGACGKSTALHAFLKARNKSHCETAFSISTSPRQLQTFLEGSLKRKGKVPAFRLNAPVLALPSAPSPRPLRGGRPQP